MSTKRIKFADLFADYYTSSENGTYYVFELIKSSTRLHNESSK